MGLLRRHIRLDATGWRTPATGLFSVLVVAAMLAAAIVSHQSSDLHRRAQVVAEQIRGLSQEMSALKWRTNTEVLLGTADLTPSGRLVRSGVSIMSQLQSATVRLERLQPGADAQRLSGDAGLLLGASLQALGATSRSSASAKQSLSQIQDRFEPILDRMDADAARVARDQQAVAAQALEQSLWESVGSTLLGITLLAGLGWRLTSLRRREIVTEKEREMERRSERRIRALVEESTDVVTVLDRDLRVRWQAASVRALLGLDPASLLGRPITTIVHPDDEELLGTFLRATVDASSATCRVRLRHADGRWLHVEIVAKDRHADPVIDGLVLNLRDVSERIAMEDELRHQAFHDALTGLANRALFEDRLRHALAAGLRTQRPLAALFIDLDDFKTINDSLGHGAGDRLLQRVAARIDPLVRPTDTTARLGGDEFAVLLDGVDDTGEAEEIAARILSSLSDGFAIDDRQIHVTASIGIALSDGTVEADHLLRNADTAMYAAKAGGKNSAQSFHPAMYRSAVERFELRTELPRALEQEEFYLDYQPIVALESRQMVAVEALVRWKHPIRGRVAPDRFIQLAEETGLIVPIGRWILERACAQAREWELAAHQASPLAVGVNVSIRQLQELDFPDRVAEVLERTGLTPGLLVLEITEGLLAGDRDALIDQLAALKRLGLRLAVDDFGTGYSALSNLQQFPIDILKIDKSFIDRLNGDPQNASLVQGIVNLGESLELDVIAEGIEEWDQANQLRTMHTHLGQGFLFSRPTDPAGILELLRQPAERG